MTTTTMNETKPIPPRPAELPPGQWTEAALRVLRERYLIKDSTGRVIETPENLCWRVAWTVAQVERAYDASDETIQAAAEAFYGLMVSGMFLPNSPTLMNCGTGNGLQYSACYVLPIEDSMESIMGTLKDAAMIHRTGGGVGYSFSALRPAGAPIRTSGGVSSGPLSFLEIFNTMTEHVRQGGRRRGANMAILRCDHPDILAFIESKLSGGITNFNISVAITDRFMEALERGEHHELLAQPGWPRPDGGQYNGGEPIGTLSAPLVWEKIVKAAWATGDPGLFFIDKTNLSAANPLPSVYRIDATNPCVTGDTLVATPDGWMAAEKIRPGDLILTPSGPLPVKRIEVSVHPVFCVRFSDGGSVRATAGHQFLAQPLTEPGAEPRPIRLDELQRGDLVQVARRGHPTLSDWTGEAKIVGIEPADTDTVYDLFEPITDRWITEGYVSRGCGEEPLPPHGSCNLGSINLARFVRAGDIDFDRLARAVSLRVRFLDNIIDINPFPLPAIRDLARQERRIGLGVMGWADLLIELRIPYDSDEAVQLAKSLGGFLLSEARRASEELAKEREPFPLFDRSRWANGHLRRNSTITTVAPTGSISVLAGCSSGIEPLFAVAFTHDPHQSGNRRTLQFMNERFVRLTSDRRILSEAVLDTIASRGTLHGVSEVPEDLRLLFKSAHEIPLERHLAHQAAWQNYYSETAVSKTVNVPHSATVDDVGRAYRLAWELGCLGITVFRDGCKGEQVLTVGTAPKTPAEIAERPKTPIAATPVIHPNPARLRAERFWKETPLGKIFATVSQNGDAEPFELFISLGKAGSDAMAFTEAIGRLISTLLRYDRLPSRSERAQEVIEQLKGIGGARSVGFGPNKILSVPDAIAQVLEEFLAPSAPPEQLELPQAAEPSSNGNPHRLGDLCPLCKAAAVVYEEGCRHCLACKVYSEC